jgi:hypothetical protein
MGFDAKTTQCDAIHSLVSSHTSFSICQQDDEIANQTLRHNGQRRENQTMKTIILALAAVLSITAGTAALSPEAHASKTYLFPPAQNGG